MWTSTLSLSLSLSLSLGTLTTKGILGAAFILINLKLNKYRGGGYGRRGGGKRATTDGCDCAIEETYFIKSLAWRYLAERSPKNTARRKEGSVEDTVRREHTAPQK